MTFSVRQLSEKCAEQQISLLNAFIDLTKAFELVSGDGLFKLLLKIGCRPIVLSLARSFYSDMTGAVQFDGSTLPAFNIGSGVKQGNVLAPTLFSIFFFLMLKYALDMPRKAFSSILGQLTDFSTLPR